MNGERLELKVGLFVAMAALILAGMIVFFSDTAIWKKGYEVKVQFGFTNGLRIGAPVRFSGVDIGNVKDIQIIGDGSVVELSLWIREGVVLREDVDVYVNTLGVMGEKYVEFLGGTPGAASIKHGWPALKGNDPVAVNEMMETMQGIAHELNAVVSSVSSIIGDEQTKKDLKETISNTKIATAHLGELAKNMNQIFEENRINIYKTIDGFSKASDKINTNLDHLEKMLKGIKEGKGFAGQLLTDEDLYQDIEGLVADIKAHPWKLLIKTKEKDSKSRNSEEVEPERKNEASRRTSTFSRMPGR